ncbi:MAG: AAA+ ATPase superfamily predicted ATPase [Crocinitomicaceae bacterium]|jgi:AAA+ ATPase superfamily predicted ATPase
MAINKILKLALFIFISSNSLAQRKKEVVLEILKKNNKLIIIDFGPINVKGDRPIEYYCHDFTTRETLVINSSSSPIHWDENLSKISRKMTRKIAKSI